VSRAQTEAFQSHTKETDRITRKNPPPPPASPPAPVEPIVMAIEDWEDEAISKIMLVTLDVCPIDLEKI
jgi:hypothetical protein